MQVVIFLAVLSFGLKQKKKVLVLQGEFYKNYKISVFILLLLHVCLDFVFAGTKCFAKLYCMARSLVCVIIFD